MSSLPITDIIELKEATIEVNKNPLKFLKDSIDYKKTNLQRRN